MIIIEKNTSLSTFLFLPALLTMALLITACGNAVPSPGLAYPASSPLPPTSIPSLLPPTITPTTRPSPLPPKLVPTATQVPAFVQTTADSETVKVAAPMFALVLPLPGAFNGVVSNAGGANIGVALVQGPDDTQNVRTDTAPITLAPTDIVVTWGDPSPYFGKAISAKGLSIPIFLDPSTNISRTGWLEGFLSMLQEGRRIILKGTLTLPVVDPYSKQAIAVVTYTFGDGAMVQWDQNSRQLIWTNMQVSWSPYP
jgi:hypothetical protein